MHTRLANTVMDTSTMDRMWMTRERWEGVLFSKQSMTTIEEEDQDLHVQFPIASEEFVEKVFSLYPSSSFNSTFWQRQTWFG